jgi:fatty-acid desaturase
MKIMKKIKAIIQNYKNKKCKTWIGKALQIVIFDNLIRLAFFTSIALLGSIGLGIIESDALIWHILFNIGWIYIVAFVIVGVLYAWGINPFKRKK